MVQLGEESELLESKILPEFLFGEDMNQLHFTESWIRENVQRKIKISILEKMLKLKVMANSWTLNIPLE